MSERLGGSSETKFTKSLTRAVNKRLTTPTVLAHPLSVEIEREQFPDSSSEHVASNETGLHFVRQAVQRATGVVIAVGVDQANRLTSYAPGIVAGRQIDISTPVNHTQRLQLEVPARIQEVLQRDPQAADLKDLYRPEQMSLVTRLLSLPIENLHQFSPEELREASTILGGKEFTTYIQYMIDNQPDSWVYDLPRLIRMYKQGFWRMQIGDIGGGSTMNAVAQDLQETHLGIFYVSNALVPPGRTPLPEQVSEEELRNVLQMFQTDQETRVISSRLPRMATPTDPGYAGVPLAPNYQGHEVRFTYVVTDPQHIDAHFATDLSRYPQDQGVVTALSE